MHQFKRYGLAAGLATLLAWGLAGCGGGSDGNQKLRVSYSSLISFGDSLSDVGTYKVGTVAALGGGKYTVNSASDKNWTELIAAQLGVSAPCAAQTGPPGAGMSEAQRNRHSYRNILASKSPMIQLWYFLEQLQAIGSLNRSVLPQT